MDIGTTVSMGCAAALAALVRPALKGLAHRIEVALARRRKRLYGESIPQECVRLQSKRQFALGTEIPESEDNRHAGDGS
jgi:hypothetical protein